MTKVLFAAFSNRLAAYGAQAAIRASVPDDARSSVRLHEREIDPMLSVDLAGSRAQDDREVDVLWRFGAVFGGFAIVGAAIDLSGVFGPTGLSATMALGSLGIVLGTLRVLVASRDVLDGVLTDALDRMRRGEVVMTVPLVATAPGSVAATVAEHGGDVMFSA